MNFRRRIIDLIRPDGPWDGPEFPKTSRMADAAQADGDHPVAGYHHFFSASGKRRLLHFSGHPPLHSHRDHISSQSHLCLFTSINSGPLGVFLFPGDGGRGVRHGLDSLYRGRVQYIYVAVHFSHYHIRHIAYETRRVAHRGRNVRAVRAPCQF